MDEWAWAQLGSWTALRLELPVSPLFCVINGPTRGRPWSSAAARADLRRTAARRACGGDSHRISFGTLTLWRWLTRASR
jgi:hypothetical protein